MTDQRLMRYGLAHKRMGLSCAEFFAMIDATGGWPLGYKYVGFEHSMERAAGFTNSHRNDGWWTVVASADDYYLWKLSPDALQRIVDAVLEKARITKVDVSRLWVKNSQGYRADLSTGGAS